MSVASNVARRWKPIAVGVVLVAVEGILINKVSDGGARWGWWLLLVLVLIGIIGCTLWGSRTRPAETIASRNDNTLDGDVNDSGAVTQQSAGDRGENVHVQADNGSFAANRVEKMGDLNFGVQRPQPGPVEPQQE